MAANNPEAAPAATPTPAGGANEPSAEATPAASSGGGIKAWLPLIVTVVTMPALAYCTTSFVLVPKMRREAAAATASMQPPTTNATSTAHAPETKPVATASAKSGEKGKEAAGASDAALKERGVKVTSDGKMTVPLNKILVNIAGSMGSRYLMAGLTLASDKEGFGDVVMNNEAQLLDLASSVLSSKTISDLEKPEARTVARAELQTVFNNALGAGTVQEVYLTEFAIQ